MVFSDKVHLKKQKEKQQQECLLMEGQNGDKYCQLMQKLTMKHLEPIDDLNSERIMVIKGIHPSGQYSDKETKIPYM